MSALEFRVSGDTRQCSFTLWSALKGPKPALPMDWESDGCSGGSPDTWRTWRGRSFKLWPACVIHDYHYRYGLEVLGLSGAAARKYADDTLRENITTLVKLQGGGRFRARRIAWAYWGRVRIWGANSFQHFDNGKPLGFWARVREAYGLH
jgi:hypothetical protein